MALLRVGENDIHHPQNVDDAAKAYREVRLRTLVGAEQPPAVRCPQDTGQEIFGKPPDEPYGLRAYTLEEAIAARFLRPSCPRRAIPRRRYTYFTAAVKLKPGRSPGGKNRRIDAYHP